MMDCTAQKTNAITAVTYARTKKSNCGEENIHDWSLVTKKEKKK